MFIDNRGKEWPLEEAKQCVGPGWGSLIERLWEYFKGREVQVNQIKEKFGGLRFYVANATDLDYMEIDQAEKDSFATCEECGEPGKPRINGWIKTLCDRHAREHEERWRAGQNFIS